MITRRFGPRARTGAEPGLWAFWVVLGLAVASCSPADNSPPAQSVEESAEFAPREPSSISPLLEDRNPHIARLLAPDVSDPLLDDSGVVRILVAYDSTNYFIDAGQQRGLEYELLRDFERFLGKRTPKGSNPARVVFLTLPFSDLIPSLLAGRGDVVAAGLTVTTERSARVRFSTPYRDGVREVVVRHENAEPVESVESLAGRTLHVARGSSFAEHLRELEGRLRLEGKAQVRVVEADPHLRSEDLLQMVHAGIHDYTVADDHVADLWAQVLDGIVVEDVAIREGGRLAWATRSENERLGKALDAYARERRQGTLAGNMLFRRYYEDTRWVEDPTEAPASDRLREFADAFRRSGDNNGIDWLMLAAVAFQESRLDPNARSAAGAVGLMQIRPSTARDKNVGVEGVEDSVEANIEAGARYLAFLQRRYFTSPEIPAGASFDFAAAAYNAGPARVQQLRREAAAEGLNPNRWFGHVEHLARARIGRETFEYVANVNKIYAALRSVRHHLQGRQRALDERG